MTKDRDKEEAHLSTSMSRVGSSATLDLHVAESTRERGRNWGWMLSGIICVNILILGTALVSSSAYSNVKISSADLQVFLIILLILTCIWMGYYTVYTARRDDAVSYKDRHAGPIWLRGGLVVFGLLSIIMTIFKISSYVGYLHCDSAVKVAFPVVQLIFVIVQTYFLWVHAKDCVQLQRNITRCGLMLTLSTNLVLWMTLVTEESVHQTVIPEDPSNTTSKLSGRDMFTRAGFGDDNCKCSHASCTFFQDAYFYLYPFTIEYSLFASAMAYVMWKNVGRAAEDHVHHHMKFRPKDAIIGPLVGVLLAVAGLATFIVYEMIIGGHGDDGHGDGDGGESDGGHGDRGDPGNSGDQDHSDDDQRDNALMMHFVTNIVIVTMMSIVTVIGSVIYRLDHRERVSEKNPTRSLDVGLLVGASMGQFIISYFTIVAMAETGAKGYLDRLNLAWAVLMVIQLGLQNFFIIEGLHREPFHEVHTVTVSANPYVLQPSKELSMYEGSAKEIKPSPVYPAHSLYGLHEHEAEPRPILSWKRRVLKEVSGFLVMGNIILWIMPAFGARPQFDHNTETEFYKFNMWAAIVNIGLPFAIFYRMHSVASLFEVYLTS